MGSNLTITVDNTIIFTKLHFLNKSLAKELLQGFYFRYLYD